jgi:hypothetical protein
MPGAQVAVDGSTYRSDNWWTYAPGSHVYRVSCLKGHCNGTFSLNSFDIDPFVMMLTGYEEGSDYDLAFPGLANTALVHGDMNCDDAINSFDIDPFVDKLSDPESWYAAFPQCEYPGCTPPPPAEGGLLQGECAGELEETVALDPAGLALAFRAYVAPERLPVLIGAAEDVAAALAGTPRGEFWAAVAAELE